MNKNNLGSEEILLFKNSAIDDEVLLFSEGLLEL